MKKVSDIREIIRRKYKDNDFVIDKTGAKLVEIIGESFIADEDFIVRKANDEYIKREIQWYESQSLYVKDIPGKTPAIWENVACKDGKINSNYGYLIWSENNFKQYEHVLNDLKSNPNSRRACMVYNRPSIHLEYNENGRSDFICTYANTFLIRDNKLHSHYLMRANDAVFGYNNDIAWAKHVQHKLHEDLLSVYPNLEIGDIIWTATSLHVYEAHFKFIEQI